MIKQVYALKSHLEETFLEGKRLPVTCFRVPEHTSTEAKNQTKLGPATLVAIGQKKPTGKKNLQGIIKKLKLNFTPRFLRQVLSDADSPAGPIDLISLFTVGRQVQVSAVSKGKGFSGVIKRWNFSTQPRTHGQSDRHRAPGSISRGTTPGRVVKGKKMAGRLGNDLKTIKNLKIVSFDPKNRLLRIAGPTPGARNTLTKITLID